MVIAPGRAARPHFLDIKRPARKPSLKSDCVFEESFLKKTGVWPPLFAFPNEKKWKLIVIPNKYPALTQAAPNLCSVTMDEGIYHARTGVGVHNLLVTRDHSKNFSKLEPALAEELVVQMQKLCKAALEDPCAIYAVPFWNWGVLAGASVWHPHYQFISLPIVPVHSARSMAGSAAYFKRYHRCVRCDIIKFERKEKVRIIAENSGAIAFVPYASKFPFEVRIMPKAHQTFFHQSSRALIRDTTALVQQVTARMEKYLNDPDINVFIHESPLDGKPHNHQHWHFEIIPRVSTPAGFELSTGIYINTTAPETTAKILRGEKL